MRPETSPTPRGPVQGALDGGRAPRRRRPRRGQSLVEFALVLTPFLLVLLGIVQFGFIFNSYVTMTNAAREGARTGTIHLYDRARTKDQNDLARNEAIRGSIRQSMNLLGTTAPHFATTGTWTKSGLVYTNGDLVVTYAIPSGITDTDARVGQTVTVRATYHQDLIVPIVANLLPKDAGGRLRLIGEVTMVIN
ncbi:MAG TPA: TadE/TadG family type IV pilus assembly protein [Vitreimonas sp.]|nr:TadE/TadG family type IV pilus assembly protein [Vitreimonas sp.]